MLLNQPVASDPETIASYAAPPDTGGARRGILRMIPDTARGAPSARDRRNPWIPACEAEPIHQPGAIQGWGALLVADIATLTVRHASANLAAFLAIPAEAALGRPLGMLLGEPFVAWLRAPGPEHLGPEHLGPEHLGPEHLGPEQFGSAPPPVRALPLAPAGHGLPPLLAACHRLGARLFIEIEPDVPGDAAAAEWAEAAAIVARLRAADTSQAVFETAAGMMRAITGAERAMVYRFDEIGHGEVVAEQRAPGLEPFLGVRYPASDIPRQARELYLRQRVRVVGDALAPAVPLLGGVPGEGPPDLSLCALRAISPIHLQYMGYMGLRTTVAVSLVVEGALWGMLVCHLPAPRLLGHAARSRCALVGDVTALMLKARRYAAARQVADMRRLRLSRVASRLTAPSVEPASMAAALIEGGADLLALCEAQGVVVRLAGCTASHGAAPTGAAAGALLDALLRTAPDPEEPCDCDELGQLGLPPESCGGAAGALLLPLGPPGDAIAWLRPEQAMTVQWGGDPHAAALIDAETGVLSPRRSFAIWLDDVRGRSLPWEEEHHWAARGLRRQLDKVLASYGETMRLERDAAARATKAKTEFLATMSHEIRSPMSGLLGVLELLRATPLDAEQSRMAGMVHNSASMLLAVLNDILDFSKIEAGALSVASEPVDLPALVGDLVQPHSVAAAGKGLACSLAVDGAVPAWVRTDPLRLRQILNNLLSNAIKFTAAGLIGLEVAVAGDPAAPVLRFVVRDSGIGMSEDVQARLFAPFMQADGSTTRNFGGTGLGLCISRQLARLLEGDLTVTSALGAGSEFVLTLPLHPSAPPAGPLEAEEAGVPVLVPAGHRVLVVDDDATIRWLSHRQLEKLGVPADMAEDGESGLERLRGGGYDLMLTDCHMPRMDGVALTEAVRRATDPALRAIPIIGLTADVTEQQQQRCLAAGMTELAIKPLTVERLAQLLQRHLSPGGAPSLAALPAAAPALRSVAFDEQIYLTMFEPGDADGAAWLASFLSAAQEDAAALAALTEAAVPERAALARLAHRLAGAAFSAGAILLGQAARSLETAAGQAEPARLRALRATVAAELAAAAPAITAFLPPDTAAAAGLTR